MDTPAFKELHDRYRPRVLRYLSSMVGRSEAEDLTQSVMLKVSDALPNFRGQSSIATWVYRIATNTALDSLRRKPIPRAAEFELDCDEGEIPPELQIASTEASAIREEMSACIREFVERLPRNYRAVMVLSELEGFTNDEIAAILGLTLGTVKIRLHRARERLRQDLEAGCSFDRDGAESLACDRKPAAPVTLHRRK